MTQTPYHHGNLRETLIAAALRIIRDEGAQAVNLRALARAVGVSHAAPARHFATRDALFAAIAERGFTALAERVAAARAGPADPRLALRRMAEAHLDWVRENAELYGAMRNAVVMRHADPALVARVREFAMVQQSFVAAAQATGWRKDEDAETALLSIVAGLAGIASILTETFLAGVFDRSEPARRLPALIDRLLAS